MAAVFHERHISRRLLARNRWTWRATGGMCAFMTVTTVIVGALNPAASTLTVSLLAIALAALTANLLLSEPPSIGELRNHYVIAVPYLGSAMIFWSTQTAAAVGAAMFIGPLASLRLVSRLEMAGHLAAATVVFAVTAAFGHLEASIQLSLLITTLAMWILGYSCWVVLESAEAQGDELERLVRRDPLTGIGNLRLLRERLAEELRRHERLDRPLTILALDLNGFKALNDSLGHAEGDALLRSVAVNLVEVVRPVDTVVRQGGDEFCILIPETGPELAIRTINAVRAAVANVNVQGVSTGIGMASYPVDALEADVLLHVADERLRRDKGTEPDPERASLPETERSGEDRRQGEERRDAGGGKSAAA